MASKKENLKSLFTNTRTRVIIIFTAILLIVAVVIGITRLQFTRETGPEASVEVTAAPGGIRSIPGALDPTVQYAKLQQEQNVSQAQVASKTGGSAIPTIIRVQALGEGVNVVGADTGKGGVGFEALSREAQGGPQQSLWIQELQNTNCSKTSVTKVVNQGAQLRDLKQACTCAQLKDHGYTLQDLEKICSCKELKAAGVNARQLKDIGYTAERLRVCGYDACSLRSAGFNAQQMKDGGFSDGELKGAGFPQDEIDRASGLPEGVTLSQVRSADCTVEGLRRLRAAGVSAAAIRRINGCTVAQLKAAGFIPGDLKNAGFSAADLKKGGGTPQQLKAAGFSARDLLNAGLTPRDLINAGFTPAEIKSAEEELPPGISADDIRNAECDVDKLNEERLAGVSATLIARYGACSANALKGAGFTNDDLANAGYSPQQIQASAPPGDDAIRAAGCDPEKLRVLRTQGVSAKRIRDLNGCSAEALRAAGFGPEALTNAGFTPEQLIGAGFNPSQLSTAGLSPSSVIADGRIRDCSVDSLRKARRAGVTALTIKQTLGCSAAALKAAGYTAKDLKDAGFTAAELKNAAFTPRELKEAGFSPKELRDAGFTAQQLKNTGFTAPELKDAGFSDTDLKNAGFIIPKSVVEGLQPAAVVVPPSAVPVTPVIAGILPQPPGSPTAAVAADQQKQLQAILARQDKQFSEQRYQQKIQQRTSQMLSAANQALQGWRRVAIQVYEATSEPEETGLVQAVTATGTTTTTRTTAVVATGPGQPGVATRALIKAGDVMFAVIDTSVNTDEPGPILATIVSGKLKGSKLIGSFNLPSNASKVVISFNTLSAPGAAKTTSISAFAIDPNTARTALSSRTDHHYLLRYGSLFASSFLEGFGNAFQSANTTVTIGGTGGGDNITIQEGINRSILENAVIGLATLGKTWGQQAQQLFSRPTTVEVCSGTGIGVLFTQDLTAL